MNAHSHSTLVRPLRDVLGLLGLVAMTACASDLSGRQWGVAFPDEPRPLLETGMHTGAIRTIDVDEAGRYLVSGGDDKTVRIWRLAQPAESAAPPELLRTLRVPIADGNLGKIYAVAISPDGKRVAVGGWLRPADAADVIYVFDRENGEIKERITGLPNVTLHLAFSKDGSRLAATLGDTDGLRVYETEGFSLVARDPDYGGHTFGADFDAAGRLFTVSFDDHVRLYDPSFSLSKLTKAKTEGDNPYSVAVSPDGRRVAVGYEKGTRVDVLSARTLDLVHSPDTEGAGKGNLSSVAWSADGGYLYAAGQYRIRSNSDRSNSVRRWDDGGRGGFKDIPIASNTIMGLKALGAWGFAVGTQDPLLAVVDNEDENRSAESERESDTADYRLQRNRLLVSEDGSLIQFGLEIAGGEPTRFDVSQRQLGPDLQLEFVLAPAVTKVRNLEIEGWKNTKSPTLNARRLPLLPEETSRSLAIATDEKRFLLGADWTLRAFDTSDGSCLDRQLDCEPKWTQDAPGITWAVNITGDGKRAVAAFGDGTIRWYDMKDGRELLAFFPHRDGERWVAWTPEGFFASSPGGEPLIGYHLNRGPDEPPEFVDVDQLYYVFYRPELLNVKLKDPEDPRIAAALRAIGNVRDVVNEGGLPPNVEFTDETHADETREGQDVDLRLRVTDRGGGIGRVVIRVNERAVATFEGTRPGAPDRRTGRTIEVPIALTLVNERNAISATAFDLAGKVESQPVTVHSDLRDEIFAPPSLYVLAIGINEYDHEALKLQNAVNDADMLTRAFADLGETLYKKRHVYSAYDDDATIAGIEERVSSIAKEARPEDVFVFYMAGHGRVMDNGKYYLLPVDLHYRNDQAILDHGISQEMLQDWVASVPAQKSLVLLDACESGAFTGTRAPSNIRTRESSEAAIDKLTRATGIATLAAASPGQLAYESYQGHGVFTYALLRGLFGDADRHMNNKDGHVTIRELAEYTGELVPKLAWEKYRIPQNPVFKLKGQSFPIVESSFGAQAPWSPSIGTLELGEEGKGRFPELPPVSEEPVMEGRDPPVEPAE